MIPVSCWCFILLLLLSKVIALDVTKQNFNLRRNSESSQTFEQQTDDESYRESSNQPHSRQKRLIWVTDDGRFALPPGTSLTIAPTLGMPLVRYPPDGFHSNLSISIPLTSELYVMERKLLPMALALFFRYFSHTTISIVSP